MKNFHFIPLSILIILLFAVESQSQKLNDIYKISFLNRNFTPSKSQNIFNVFENQSAKNLIVQFNQPLSSDKISRLKELGIKINGQISSTALSVFVDDKNQLNKLEAADKLSGGLNDLNGEIYVVVNFHRASNPIQYFSEIKLKNAEIIKSLSSNDLLIKIDKSSLNNLASIEGIAFIYPASDKLINDEPVHKCPGVLRQFGFSPAYVKQGEGWDGPGLGSANLKYHFVNGTPDVAGEQAEVVAALETWSYYAQINWSSTANANQNRSIDISWGASEHGDGFPFDGTGSVLAHCFYPDDTNPETIAGDLHFDEDELWKIGNDIDVYSVALHESGHGLGLNHSDDPNAVMYPYYGGAVSDLREDDINGIRELYQSRTTNKTSDPVFDPASGAYPSPLEVRLNYGSGSNSQNTRIYYTLDGSEPTPYSFEFIPGNDYIFQRFSNTIKARAFRQGFTPSNIVSATYILQQSNPTVENPAITPNGGTFNGSILVSMSCPTDFSVIRYTTDGTEPAQSSFAYSSPITLNSSATVKAKAFRNDYTPSQTVIANFNVNLNTTEPTLYPGAGVYIGSVTVYMGSAVPGADIYYTTDGSIPTALSTLFTSPIEINQTTLVKAVAIYNNTSSDVVSNWYNINQRCTEPVINPNGGNFTGSVTVNLTTTTPNAEIRYTTNGAEPTTYSTKYTAPFDLGIGEHVVKAKTFHSSLSPSTTSSADFNVFDPSPTTVATPDMYPRNTQTFTEPVHITMSCATEGAVIRYTVGFGQLPADPEATGGGSITYSGPFNIGASGQDLFIKVRAFKTGLTPSGILQSGKLSVTDPLGQVEKPTFDPPGGDYNNNIQVTIASNTQSAQILYTKDGSEPSSNLPITTPTFTFNSSLNLSTSTKLISKGRRTFFTDSDTAVAEYILKCGTPEITPDSGLYIDSVKVIMTTVTTSASIKYTTDGSEPTDSSTLYTGPINLEIGSYVIKAKSFKFNFEDSETSIAQFEVNEPDEAPVIISHPVSKEVQVGDNVTFKVEVTGTPKPSIQWMRNAVDLAGEITDSLLFENIQPGDAGKYKVRVSNSAGEIFSNEAVLIIKTTAVKEITLAGKPVNFELIGNYPNPFNPSTVIRFAIPKTSRVNIQVFNVTGELVSTLLNSEKGAGYYELQFNAKNMASGVYFYKIQAGTFSQVKKMLLLK